MNDIARAEDVAALPPAYRRFWEAARAVVPPAALACDPVRTLAWGTDASFYRLVPKIVVKVRREDEVVALLAAAARLALPVTFRAAGTSLSGQAVTDSILLVLAGGWKERRVEAGGARIALGPGVIGAEANAALAPLGRKIGPDPASIGACMVGGIVANNASGMCCGTTQNSYRTLESLKLVLADGTRLDTGDPASRAAFAAARPEVVAGLARLRDEIAADRALAERIRRKYRIKNTTGYGLNAFLDFTDPIDILAHLIVGSEGTLAFVSEVTFRTVEEHAHRASALLLFPDLAQAALATQRLKAGPVAAAEIMDRPSLRSVEGKPGMPPVLATLGPAACALLVETRAASAEALARQAEEVAAILAGLPTLEPIAFTAVKAEFERLWDVRRGIFPSVGAARKIGTTVVIEDVAFPIERLAEGTVALQNLMLAHRYDEGVIFGHALDGNLHFVFTQGFDDPREVARYGRFMDEVAEMVVRRFDGSLKGEHGTGRNMAPFVALEWGEAAYGVMRRVKALLDPAGLLNPRVLLDDDPRAHLKHLKPLPPAHEIVDRCTECGFCEPRCPSRDLTLTPRQRIVTRREIARLVATGESAERLERFEAGWAYLGDETCATDGLCQLACPAGIDTGKLTKRLRADARTPAAEDLAEDVAAHFAGALAGVRAGLATAHAAHAVLGTRLMGAITRGARAASLGHLPQWTPALPTRSPRARLEDVRRGRGREVVYFPACVARAMGPAAGAPDARALHEATLSLLEKAGYDVLFPEAMDRLCCGLAFESKGFPELADAKAKELEAALLAKTDGGRIPVLCDTSPCLYRMQGALDPRLRLHEPVGFIHAHLMDKLRFERRPETVAIHVTCSAIKMGLDGAFKAVAAACAERVVAPPTGCCGFAGDKGFTTPELNASALSGLRAALPPDCKAGFSNSRTCEIGLSTHGGVPYQSIVYLVDACTRPLP
ncbi:FAD-binding and (Fe-S)-binding domain-containing protein [Anaeromyxobacter diazotrophicus]|uniref:D-lactate dehydrogenase (cytochrome) n=1 Tax=Anaeromyxobacter diazotrophicus TaxID=2590199 RepID=A0A7I9VNE1_9BACT|nr:FAD-binding and (Fe-S)-binding domain-containing protein [Anaeromyxobacter diazotrophicus]GEJ57911.1 oxidoreductase [Anaeromyxobacter diazotrophicus]